MPPVSPPDTTSVQLAFKATSSNTASSNVSATLIDRRNHLLINLNPDMSKFVSAVVHIDHIEQTDPLKLKQYPLRPGQNYIGTNLTVSPTDIRYDFTDLSRYSIKIVVLSKEVGTAPSSLSSYFSYGTESARQNLECYNYLFRNDGGDNFANVSISNPNEMVIGFMTISGIMEKRIFINYTQVPGWNFNMNCGTLTVPNRKDSLDAYFKDGKNLVTISNLGASGKIETYNGSTANCLDCRLKGSSIKPVFW